MDEWIVELCDLSQQRVRAVRVEEREGHLLAYQYRTWDDKSPTAAWAPGIWRRFWARPKDKDIERFVARLAAVTRMAEVEQDSFTKFGLESYAEELRGKIDALRREQ